MKTGYGVLLLDIECMYEYGEDGVVPCIDTSWTHKNAPINGSNQVKALMQDDLDSVNVH